MPCLHIASGQADSSSEQKATGQGATLAGNAGTSMSSIVPGRLAPAVNRREEDEEALDVARAMLRMLPNGSLPPLDVQTLLALAQEWGPFLQEMLPGLAVTGALLLGSALWCSYSCSSTCLDWAAPQEIVPGVAATRLMPLGMGVAVQLHACWDPSLYRARQSSSPPSHLGQHPLFTFLSIEGLPNRHVSRAVIACDLP